jgi:hypothetical protein
MPSPCRRAAADSVFHELQRLAAARVRILAAYVVLLAVSMVASLFFIERILTTGLYEEINADIQGEYRELRRGAGCTPLLTRTT